MAHYPLYTQNLSLVGVCVKRIGKPESTVPIVEPEVSDRKIEIRLSNGHKLSVSGAFDPDAVARLLRGLSS